MSRCYAYIVAYISRLEIGNVVLRPARLEVGHYDTIYGRSDGASLRTFFDSDLKSTYCFCAHMHEITKYFLHIWILDHECAHVVVVVMIS